MIFELIDYENPFIIISDIKWDFYNFESAISWIQTLYLKKYNIIFWNQLNYIESGIIVIFFDKSDKNLYVVNRPSLENLIELPTLRIYSENPEKSIIYNENQFVVLELNQFKDFYINNLQKNIK